MEKQENIAEIINMVEKPHVLRPHKYIANLKIYLSTMTRTHHKIYSIGNTPDSHDCGHNLYVSEEKDFSYSSSQNLSIALQHIGICDLFLKQMYMPLCCEQS